ncbi:MAG TPA: 4Fe-4S dicluster domain-containing protein [bacterium]|nr:4Fe-4S dicluster domain-containing protein [bacterium]
MIDKDKIYFEIDQIVSEIGTTESAVIPILHTIQKKYNYLPEIALRRVCETTDITPASITGVSTFYSQFRHTPTGKHLIHICSGTSCLVKGSELVYDAFSRELSIKENQDTDPEGLFTLLKVSCLGCCTLAPVVQIDNVTYEHVKTNSVSKILQGFISYQSKKVKQKTSEKKYTEEVGEIRIGLGSCCVTSGSSRVQQELENSLVETGIQTQLKQVGCMGMCHRATLLEVRPPNQKPVLYEKVQPEEVKQIILKHYKPKSLKKRLTNAATGFLENILNDNQSNGFIPHSINTRDPQIESYLGRQIHIVTEYSDQIDPLNLQDYRSKNGFEALKRCLEEYSPEEIIENIKESGLRGKGGAGFPTGQKWQIVHQAQDEKKYIICNMNRMILESYPYRVIEGMVIAAFAVGASEGFFYINAEYSLAFERVRNAIYQCEKTGLLGEEISGSDFSLKLQIFKGADAFICGEETALIASIEGSRGMPNFRPLYPAQKGLWGHPTLVNNCETYATIPWIIRNGAGAFSKLGSDKSNGTKVVSLTGKVARGGLIEVPMGISIREIVEEIGGGIENGGHFKAVQIGGPSGGCIPAELADTKIDYEDLAEAGAMMGSGGLLVMDENDCMVDFTRYFLTFICSQSCGKCTYCRIGTRHMLTILEKICAGKGTQSDLQKLEIIAQKTKQGSLCGFGKTAPNPVLTTLTYFQDEYDAHLNGICPAKRCKDLISYSIDESCIGCTICAQKCPVDAISITPYQKHIIDQDLCTKCDTCKQVCPTESVVIL